MPYFVLIAGTLVIVFIWVSFGQRVSHRAKVEAAAYERSGEYGLNAVRRAHNEALAASVLGTLVVLAAIWFWGVQALITDQQRVVAEQQWLDTFIDRHREKFDRDCEDILSRMSPVTGIVYDRDSGRVVSVLSCQQGWGYPAVPSEYSASKYDQPDRTPPFASTAIFGEGTTAIMCADLSDESTCYTWDDFAGPS